jgi:hypothetical protein
VADLLYLLVVLAFFAIAALVVRACALVVGRQAMAEDERTP